MIGIELDRPCGAIMQRALDAGLLLSVTADSVVRLLPPLILTQTEADELVSILVPLIKNFLAETA
jgi:acetylornithine/N-succinyldiaminopimelate aminotransferase